MIFSYLCTEQKMKNMIRNKNLRAETNRIMVENNTDLFPLPVETAFRYGIEYVTLKGKRDIKGYNFEEELVPVPDEAVREIYDIVRKEYRLVDPHELSEEEMSELCKQIVIGSLYVADYENSFGIDPRLLSDYVDGWLETKENPEEYGYYETLYDYVQSFE